MASEKQVRELIEITYQAAEDPAYWQSFIAQFTAVSRGMMGALFWRDGAGKQYQIDAIHGIPDEYARLYLAHYGAKDLWFNLAPGKLRTGWVGTGQSLCLDSVLEKSEFYNDFLRRFDVFHQCGGIIDETGPQQGAITLLRSKRSGEFGQAQIDLIRTLLPHMRRAVTLHKKFIRLTDRSTSFESALDRVDIGIALLNDSGEVVHMNRKAANLLRSRDGICIRSGRIVSLSNPHTIDGIVAACRNAQDSLRSRASIPRRGNSHLNVTASRLQDRDHRASKERTILFFEEPDQLSVAPASELALAYGLTPTESKVAGFLAQGTSLRDACETFHIRYETGRTHLKRILAKTGARRQSELLRMLTRPRVIQHS